MRRAERGRTPTPDLKTRTVEGWARRRTDRRRLRYRICAVVTVGGGARASGSPCRAGLNAAPTLTSEKARTRAGRDGAGADGFVEDEDAADEGGQLGRHRGEGDDLDAGPEPEAAVGLVEGMPSGDEPPAVLCAKVAPQGR
jgi:hypothetical protein